MNDNVNNDMTVDIPAAGIPAVCAGSMAADVRVTETLALSPIGSGVVRPGCRRRRGDFGEGVISAAIAVLIVAFLGAAMWVGFNTIWGDAQKNITEQVNRIGNNHQ